MKRNIWPVGHGTFCTEKFYYNCNNFTIVYDCGGNSKAIKTCVEEFLPEIHSRDSKPVIDMVFISHFHHDHINGLDMLMNRANVRRFILPQIDNTTLAEAYIYNLSCVNLQEMTDADFCVQDLIYSLATNQERFREVPITKIRPSEEGEQPDIYTAEEFSRPVLPSGSSIVLHSEHTGDTIWEFIPVNVYRGTDKQNKLIKLLQVLSVEERNPIVDANGNIDFDILKRWAENKEQRKKLIEAYKDVFEKKEEDEKKGNLNASCMPLYSGPRDAVRTHVGKFTIDEFWGRKRMYRWYGDYNYMYDSRLIRHTSACLYMGDFEPLTKVGDKTHLALLREQLTEKRWNKIGLQQIPHHISNKNYCMDLYEQPKVCFGNINGERDTSFSQNVINRVSEYCLPCIITENDGRISEWIDID